MTSQMPRVAADTSVLVAAFASWHERHEAARAALDEGALLVAQCALETYSVLTRLPAPHRVGPHVVAAFLRMRFSGNPLLLPPAAHRTLVSRLAEAGVAGGAVYDALVALTAARHGATLLTLDARAEPTYARVGAAFRQV
jgi:predicted nucleic acid-binding protein